MMANILRSEWLKTKRTPLRPLAFITPFLYAALIIWYFSRKEITFDVQLSVFRAFFGVWTVSVIPIGVGIIAGFVSHQENLAGNFHHLLGSRFPRSRLYFGKLGIPLFLVTASTFMATSALILGFGLVLDVWIAWPIFMAAAILALIGTFPLLAFHYWISLAWGFGASIGIGGVGLLIAGLMATSLGDTVWPYVPWAWPIRLSMLAGAYLTYFPGMDSPPEIIASGHVWNQVMKGVIAAAIGSAGMLAGGAIWFDKWEGRNNTD